MEKIGAFVSKSEKQTIAIAKKFALSLERGSIVLLEGDLGAGKTVFARGIACRFSKNVVSSPTFAVMNVYEGKIPVFHFDFYRLGGADELAGIGAEEFLFDGGISVVEWPERAPDIFDEVFLVKMLALDEKSRQIEIFKGKYGKQ